MAKYRLVLPWLTDLYSQRYFYVGSVFLVWFLCSAASSPGWRHAAAAVSGIALLLSLNVTAKNSRESGQDLEWPVWANHISSGLPVNIPINPRWIIYMPAAPGGGPLARFGPWVGKKLNTVVASINADSCEGMFLSAVPLVDGVAKGRWVGTGWGWNVTDKKPLHLVAMVDSEMTILGFGFPGFKHPDARQAIPLRSGWRGDFAANPGMAIHAYGIVADGRRACLLENQLLASIPPGSAEPTAGRSARQPAPLARNSTRSPRHG
jgi:hypothetical protein